MKRNLHNAIWLYYTIVTMFGFSGAESIMLVLSGQSTPQPIVAFCIAPIQAVAIPFPLKR
jgi:hypothetical protein